MSVIQAVTYLNEYANALSNDANFKEFSHALFTFTDKIKGDKNINDKDIFIEELQKELLSNYTEDKNYKDFFFIQASALALEMENNNFIDMEKYYKNFQKAYQSLKEKEQEDDLLSNEPQKNELISELLQNLDFNENASLEQQKLKEQISSYENALENDDFITPLEDEFKEEAEKIKPSELIAFIKDEKQISYPFDREATLKDSSFMRDFRKELNALGTKELEEMVRAMKAKNEALKKELEELKNQKESLLLQLQGEMVANSNLSLAKEEQSQEAKENENPINENTSVEEEKEKTQEEIDLSEPNADESNMLFQKIAQAQAEADKWEKTRENEEQEDKLVSLDDENKKEDLQKPNLKRKM